MSEDKNEEQNEEEVEVPEKFEDIVEEIEEMSVLELSELVEILEDKFGVSAGAPAAAAPAAAAQGGGSDDSGDEEEQTEFDVKLEDFGDAKIQVIKAVKGATDMGLADAKSLVDDAPSVIKEGLDKEEAEEMQEELEDAGATVSLE